MILELKVKTSREKLNKRNYESELVEVLGQNPHYKNEDEFYNSLLLFLVKMHDELKL